MKKIIAFMLTLLLAGLFSSCYSKAQLDDAYESGREEAYALLLEEITILEKDLAKVLLDNDQLSWENEELLEKERNSREQAAYYTEIAEESYPEGYSDGYYEGYDDAKNGRPHQYDDFDAWFEYEFGSPPGKFQDY